MTEIGELHVETSGPDATAVVFVPPNPLDGSSWLFQVAHFSTWFRTLTVDLPGYGHSPRLQGPTTMPGLADAIWSAVRGYGVERAVVAGVSIGASLALYMANRQPDRTVALIISGYGHGRDKPWAARRIEGYQRGGLAYRRQHLAEGFSPQYASSSMGRFVRRLAEDREDLVDVASIIRLFEAHGASDPGEIFDVPCPALLIMGSEDYAYQRAGALHERIADSELAVIDGAGHACNIEQPQRWNALALEFLHRRAGIPAAR